MQKEFVKALKKGRISLKLKNDEKCFLFHAKLSFPFKALYLKSDKLLLIHVLKFLNFRKMLLEIYEPEPAKFISVTDWLGKQP